MTAEEISTHDGPNGLFSKIQRFFPERDIRRFSIYRSDLMGAGFYPLWMEDLSHTDGTLHEVLIWCQEQFGNDWIWTAVNGGHDFFFVKDEDKTLFKLKWWNKPYTE